jgi:hypothetical protein
VLVFSAYRASVRDIGPIGPGGFRRCFRASAGVIVLTSGAVIAARYAFVCQIRAERVARAAVNRVRETQPVVWHELDWIVRLANTDPT